MGVVHKSTKCGTHPADNLILAGIARAHLIRACRRLGIPVKEEAFTIKEMHAADEVIVTSSSNLCLHADEIDDWSVGGKDPTRLEKIRTNLLSEFYKETD